MNGLLIPHRADVPTAPLPPGEGRRVTHLPVHVTGVPTLGPIETPPSFLAGDRPARVQMNTYHRDQSLAQDWHNNGEHVAVGRHAPGVEVTAEPSIYPQRPTSRTPALPWTSPLLPANDSET